MSKLKENLNHIKEKAYDIALITFGFILNPIALYLLKRIKIRRNLAKNVPISSEWTKFYFKPPVEIKNNIQAVLLSIEGCWKDFNDKDLKLPNGTIIKPEIEISDQFGNVYHLKSVMSLGMPNNEINKWFVREAGFSERLPKNRKYREIKVRSDVPFICDTISWYDYSLK